MGILDNFQEVVVETPVDVIIKQIKQLLSSGQIKPGDRLPSERKLAEKFGVGRTHVRDAIKKLEFYGILKTLPQSGSIVAGLEISALEGLITDVLKLDNYDFYSLVETRMILETNAVQLCAMRRSEEDLREIEASLNRYCKKIEEKQSAVEEDLNFHRKIAEGSGNQVIKSLMLIITPDILSNYTRYNVCKTNPVNSMNEHRELFNCIKNKEAEKAIEIMREHLSGVMEFSKTQKIF